MSVTQRLDDEIIARLERGRLRNAGLLKEDQ